MNGRLQRVVQATDATIVLEHGKEAAVLSNLANLGILGLLRQMESWLVRP